MALRSRSDRLVAAVGGLPSGVTADARFVRETWTTIRFANGRIHQPLAEQGQYLSFRVAEGGRLGTATTVDLSPDGIRSVVRAARALARIAPIETTFTTPAIRPPGARSAAEARIRSAIRVAASGVTRAVADE